MQFNFLKINSPPLVGVDISSTAIKLVEFGEMGRERCSLERYAIEPLPKDAIVEGNIAKMDEVVEAMRRAWERLGSRSRHVALALPAAAVITKKIILPADLTEEEMEIQVEAEANQVIPFALDEVNLDFQILNPVPNSVNDVEVLIVASRKEKVEDRVAVAEAAGLKVLVVDTEFNASQTAYEGMAHILPESGRGQIVALIDIGATTMHILVFVNNIMVYSREQSFGGNQLTLEIQRRYGLTSEEAEKAKRKGNSLENYDLEVLHPFIETLALEISRALQLFFSSTSYIKVDHIVLAGGCTVLPGLDEAVANRTEASTLVANPFVGMTLSARVLATKLAMDAPALMVACGLAMRRFDTV